MGSSTPVVPILGLFISLACWHWPAVIARWVVDSLITQQHTKLPLIDALRLCLLRNAQEWLPRAFIQVQSRKQQYMITFASTSSLPNPYQTQTVLVNNASKSVQSAKLHHEKINIPFSNDNTPLQAYWFGTTTLLPPPTTHTIVLWLHGGYYLVGCATMHAHAFDAWLRHAHTHLAVFSLEYTLTPEVAFPHALQQSMWWDAHEYGGLVCKKCLLLYTLLFVLASVSPLSHRCHSISVVVAAGLQEHHHWYEVVLCSVAHVQHTGTNPNGYTRW